MNITWNKIKSNCLKNLWVAFDSDGNAVGMIDKPADDRQTKNFWRMYHGVGNSAQFLGHSVTKREAMNHVHFAVCLNTATVTEVEK
jgi:hypothetical protein